MVPAARPVLLYCVVLADKEAICENDEVPPTLRSTRYDVSEVELSFQDKLICEEDTAVAVRLNGGEETRPANEIEAIPIEKIPIITCLVLAEIANLDDRLANGVMRLA